MNKHWKLASDSKRKGNTKTIWFYLIALPIAAFLGVTDFGSRPIEPDDFWILSIPLIVVGALTLLIKRYEREEKKKEIEIRYDEGVAIFRNYRFITKFTGDKVRDYVSVPFTGFYRSKVTRGRGDNVSLDLMTDQGKVTIDSYTDLPEIIESFEQMTRLNKEQNEDFHNDLDSAPTPKTPWYGWAILALSVFALAYISWSYLKNT